MLEEERVARLLITPNPDQPGLSLIKFRPTYEGTTPVVLEPVLDADNLVAEAATQARFALVEEVVQRISALSAPVGIVYGMSAAGCRLGILAARRMGLPFSSAAKFTDGHVDPNIILKIPKGHPDEAVIIDDEITDPIEYANLYEALRRSKIDIGGHIAVLKRVPEEELEFVSPGGVIGRSENLTSVNILKRSPGYRGLEEAAKRALMQAGRSSR